MIKSGRNSPVTIKFFISSNTGRAHILNCWLRRDIFLYFYKATRHPSVTEGISACKYCLPCSFTRFCSKNYSHISLWIGRIFCLMLTNNFFTSPRYLSTWCLAHCKQKLYPVLIARLKMKNTVTSNFFFVKQRVTLSIESVSKRTL